MNAAELIELLGSPERWIRYQAKRLLFDSRRDEVLSAADSRATFWARDVNRLPLLRDLAGVYRAHNAASLPILNALSNAEDPRLRAYSMRLAGAWTEHLNEAEPILLQGTTDDHPRVRLEALVAGTKLPHGKGFQIFQNVYGAPHDRFIEYALINAARLLRPHWQAVLRIDPASITPAQKEFLEQSAGAAQTQKEPGQLLYENICLNCHQPEGKGLPGIYPPLVKNPRVTGNPEPLVQMLLHGLQGPLTTNGTVYNNIMPPSGLSDEEIVLVLTYVRSHFDNAAPGIDVGQVEAMRQKYADRASPWTPEELIPSDTN